MAIVLEGNEGKLTKHRALQVQVGNLDAFDGSGLVAGAGARCFSPNSVASFFPLHPF